MDKEGERWKHKWKAMKIQLDKKEQVQEWDWFTCKDIPFHKENTFLRYEDTLDLVRAVEITVARILWWNRLVIPSYDRLVQVD